MIDADAFANSIRRAQAELATDVADAEVAASRLRTDIGETWASIAGRLFPAAAGAAFTALDEARRERHAATVRVLADLRVLSALAAELTDVANHHLAARDDGAAGYTPRKEQTREDRQGVDWSRYLTCHVCLIAPGEPCIDYRDLSNRDTVPHPGRPTRDEDQAEEDRRRPGDDDEAKVRAAQDRQDAITSAEHAGDLAAEIDDLEDNAPGETRARVEALARANPALAPLVESMLTGDRWAVAREHGAVPIGKVGGVEPFDPHRHLIHGDRPNPGELVEILRPGVGYVHEPDTVIKKAVAVQIDN